MPIITREQATACRICRKFEDSPAYDPDQDALVYPDEIDDGLLRELAKDPQRLMWLANNGLIACDYMRARLTIRAVREAREAQKAKDAEEAKEDTDFERLGDFRTPEELGLFEDETEARALDEAGRRLPDTTGWTEDDARKETEPFPEGGEPEPDTRPESE